MEMNEWERYDVLFCVVVGDARHPLSARGGLCFADDGLVAILEAAASFF